MFKIGDKVVDRNGLKMTVVNLRDLEYYYPVVCKTSVPGDLLRTYTLEGIFNDSKKQTELDYLFNIKLDDEFNISDNLVDEKNNDIDFPDEYFIVNQFNLLFSGTVNRPEWTDKKNQAVTFSNHKDTQTSIFGLYYTYPDLAFTLKIENILPENIVNFEPGQVVYLNNNRGVIVFIDEYNTKLPIKVVFDFMIMSFGLDGKIPNVDTTLSHKPTNYSPDYPNTTTKFTIGQHIQYNGKSGIVYNILPDTSKSPYIVKCYFEDNSCESFTGDGTYNLAFTSYVHKLEPIKITKQFNIDDKVLYQNQEGTIWHKGDKWIYCTFNKKEVTFTLDGRRWPDMPIELTKKYRLYDLVLVNDKLGYVYGNTPLEVKLKDNTRAKVTVTPDQLTFVCNSLKIGDEVLFNQKYKTSTLKGVVINLYGDIIIIESEGKYFSFNRFFESENGMHKIIQINETSVNKIIHK